MENNPLERDAVTKAAQDAENDTLELTLRENVGTPKVEDDGFADTVLDFPAITVSDEDFYRVPTQVSTIEVTQLVGNKPHVPDVVPNAKTVSAVETDPAVLNEILANSPINQAQLSKEIPETESWTRPAPQREQKQPTSWLKRILGGK